KLPTGHRLTDLIRDALEAVRGQRSTNLAIETRSGTHQSPNSLSGASRLALNTIRVTLNPLGTQRVGRITTHRPTSQVGPNRTRQILRRHPHRRRSLANTSGHKVRHIATQDQRVALTGQRTVLRRRVRQSTTDRGTNTRRGTTDKVKRAPHTVSHLASNTGTNTGHITDRVANPTRQTAKRVSSILGTRPRGTRNLITEPRIRRRADAGHAAVSEVHNPVPDAPSSRAHGVGVRNNPASDPRPEAPHVRGTAVRLRGGLRGAVANRAEVTSGLIRGPVSRRSDRRTQIRELAADTRSDRVRTTKHLASRLIPGVYELV